jgi:hypothetical protein
MGNCRGDEFPAFLTFGAGLEKTFLDLMCPEFDKGMQPESFSDKVLELHSKEYTCALLCHEQDHAVEIHIQRLSGMNQAMKREMFFTF